MLLMATVCESSGVLQAIYIIKQVIMMIFIMVPIVIIITSSSSLFKAVIDKDDGAIKDAGFLLLKKILVGAAVFFIPIIINAGINLINANTEGKAGYIACYTNATPEKIAYYKKLEQKAKEEAKEKYEQENEENQEKAENSEPNYGNNNSAGNNNSLSGNTGGSNNSSPEASGGIINTNANISGNMYIGDSRTVGMYFSLYSDSYTNSIAKTTGSDFWYAYVGQGYSWFSSTAIYQIKSKLNTTNYNVTIQMGANDLTNSSAPESYISVIKDLATQYPNSNFVIVSVNPIQDSNIKGYSVRNADVGAFNNRLVASFNTSKVGNMYYCDVYSKIIGSYATTDGLHYTSETYKKIYSAINGCL